jgi:K+-sensing histidine kinase KdpD
VEIARSNQALDRGNSPPRFDAARRSHLLALVSGPLITIGLVVIAEVMAPLLNQFTNPIPIFLLAVVYAAFRGGLYSGMVSAVITAAYTLYYFSEPNLFLRYSVDNALRAGVLSVTALALAVMVGVLKHVHEQAARLQGALLAVRTMEHYLNNQLTATVGYCEILARSRAIPENLRPPAQEALDGALAASATLARLARITRFETDAELAGPVVLDLERSTDGQGTPRP